MPNSIIQPSMAGGELAPSLYGRVDLARYLTSLKLCKNFVSQVYGGVRNRAGTRFLNPTKYPNKRARLIPFVFNQAQTYVLEVGDYYLRAFTNRLPLSGVTNQPNNGTMHFSIVHDDVYDLVSSVNMFSPSDVGRDMKISTTGFYDTFRIITYVSVNVVQATCPRSFAGVYTGATPYWKFVGNPPGTVLFETVTPWAEAELRDLVFTQSADVLTVVHPDHPPQDIRRLTDGTFEVRTTPIINGPFQDVNVNKNLTITITATVGSLTVNASAPIFQNSHVGQQLYIEPMSYGQPWAASKIVVSGNIRMANGKYYRAMTGGTTGTVAPSHDEDVASDGLIDWMYLHSGFGVMTITAVSSPIGDRFLAATAVSQGALPEGLNIGTAVPLSLTVTSYAISPLDPSRIRVVVPAAHGLATDATVGYFATL